MQSRSTAFQGEGTTSKGQGTGTRLACPRKGKDTEHVGHIQGHHGRDGLEQWQGQDRTGSRRPR